MIIKKLILITISVLLAFLSYIGINESKKNEGKLAMYAMSFLFLITGIFLDSLKRIFLLPVGKLLLVIQIPVIICFLLVIYLIISSLIFKSTGNSEFMLVLGTTLDGENPGPLLKGRLDSALIVLEENKGTKAVVSGGQVRDEVISEGECMYNFLSNHGIDKARLRKETESETTYFNFVLSLPILSSIGFSNDMELDVVTDMFHFARSRKLAKRAGYENIRFCCAKTDYLHSFNWWFREILVIIKIWIEGPETK